MDRAERGKHSQLIKHLVAVYSRKGQLTAPNLAEWSKVLINTSSLPLSQGSVGSPRYLFSQGLTT